MAAKTVEVEELMNTVLVCDVCMEPFDSGTRVPLLLPCRHSFCLSCLESLSKGGDFRCPTCRHLVPVSGPVATSLPKDIISLKVVDYLTMKSAAQKVPCTDCVDKNTAGYRCLTCHLNLCQACQDGHRRVPFLRSHTVRSLEELAAAPGDFLAEAETCGEHVGVALNLYCDSQACKVALCTSCAMVAHRQDSHSIMDLAKVHERARKEYTELLGLLEKEEEKHRKLSEDFQRKLKLVTSAAKVRDQVNQTMDKLLEAVEKRRKQLLEEVRQTKDGQKAELKKMQEETSSHVSQIQEATGYLRRAERLSRQAEFISVVHAQGPSIRKLVKSGLLADGAEAFSDDRLAVKLTSRWADSIQFEAGDGEKIVEAVLVLGSVSEHWRLSGESKQTQSGQGQKEVSMVTPGSSAPQPRAPEASSFSFTFSGGSDVCKGISNRSLSGSEVKQQNKGWRTDKDFVSSTMATASSPKTSLSFALAKGLTSKPTEVTLASVGMAPSNFGPKISVASLPDKVATSTTSSEDTKSMLGKGGRVEISEGVQEPVWEKKDFSNVAAKTSEKLAARNQSGSFASHFFAQSTQTCVVTMTTSTPAKTLGFGAATGGTPSLGSLAASSAVAPAFQTKSPQEGFQSAGHTLFQKQGFMVTPRSAAAVQPKPPGIRNLSFSLPIDKRVSQILQNKSSSNNKAVHDERSRNAPDQVKVQAKAEEKKPSFQFGAAPTIQSSGFTFGSAAVPSQPSQSTPLYELLKRDESSWECCGCLVSNKVNVLRCPACQALKPGVKPEDAKDMGSGVKAGSATVPLGGFQFGSTQMGSGTPAQTGGFTFGGFYFGAKTASPAPGASQASPAVQEAETRPVPKNSGNRTLLEQLQADDIGMKPDATSTPVASAYTPGTAATQSKPAESKGFSFSMPGGSGDSEGFNSRRSELSNFEAFRSRHPASSGFQFHLNNNMENTGWDGDHKEAGIKVVFRFTAKECEDQEDFKFTFNKTLVTNPGKKLPAHLIPSTTTAPCTASTIFPLVTTTSTTVPATTTTPIIITTTPSTTATIHSTTVISATTTTPYATTTTSPATSTSTAATAMPATIISAAKTPISLLGTTSTPFPATPTITFIPASTTTITPASTTTITSPPTTGITTTTIFRANTNSTTTITPATTTSTTITPATNTAITTTSPPTTGITAATIFPTNTNSTTTITPAITTTTITPATNTTITTISTPTSTITTATIFRASTNSTTTITPATTTAEPATTFPTTITTYTTATTGTTPASNPSQDRPSVPDKTAEIASNVNRAGDAALEKMKNVQDSPVALATSQSLVDSNPPFRWPCAGEKLFCKDSEPIIPLPLLVEKKTGEEGWTPIYSQRCKLYRYDNASNQWKERGIGEMKILKDEKQCRYRLLMWREQVLKVACNQMLKVACNQMLTSDLALKPLATSETAWCWVATDFSEGKATVEKFAVKFKNKDLSKALYDLVTECQTNLRAVAKASSTEVTKFPVQESSAEAEAEPQTQAPQQGQPQSEEPH